MCQKSTNPIYTNKWKEGCIMESKQSFDKAKKKYLKTLEQYVAVVARVHGKSHPEFYEVQKVFDRMVEKIKGAKKELPELGQEFDSLRRITENYNVPEDVCESYEAVYQMLEELDRAYHK